MVRTNDQHIVLTETQAACLTALRDGKSTVPSIALQAKVVVANAATTARKLLELGLAVRDQAKRWHVTHRGGTCQIEMVSDRARRDDGVLGPGSRRVLDELTRPMAVTKIAARVGLSHQRVRQLVIKLHVQGLVRFGDPERPFWLVMRADDQTFLLSREEERVLSALPAEFATTAIKIHFGASMPERKVRTILDRLIAGGLVVVVGGWPDGGELYRFTAAGLNHPQRKQSRRKAKPPRLAVGSDRVRRVLSAISQSGTLRIRDVSEAVGLPHQSMNALMQYLKRRQLVKKTGEDYTAPYSLTDYGQATLAEMTLRRAA